MSKDTSQSCAQKDTPRDVVVLPTLIDRDASKIAKPQPLIADGSRIGSASTVEVKHVDNVDVKPEASPPTKKIRKPCYGWISDGNSDDEDNFIMLPPMEENTSFKGA